MESLKPTKHKFIVVEGDGTIANSKKRQKPCPKIEMDIWNKHKQSIVEKYQYVSIATLQIQMKKEHGLDAT